jgi:hypothetical protein
MTVRAPSLPIKQRVVRLLETGLPDDVAALERVVGLDLRVGRLTHVAEQVRAELVRRILARRHLLHDDVGQLEVESPGRDRRHLRERRVLDDDDGPVGRLVQMAIDDLPHVPLVHARHGGQHADRSDRDPSSSA